MTNDIVGISLGTINAIAAVYKDKRPIIIPSSEGECVTPTVVAFTVDGELLVGRSAKGQAVTNPTNTLYAVKRLIGRRFSDKDVRTFASKVPYKIISADNGDAWVEVNGKKMAPPEILAKVLWKLKKATEEHLGSAVSGAVISVPAYFDDFQRQAIKDAGRIAGLEVRRIINDTTAVALAYALDKRDQDRTIAIYDLGGGSFDVSIIEIASIDGDIQIEVLSINGDTFLGGEDLDQRIVDHMVMEFKKENNIDLRSDSLAMQRLKEAAEKAKIELSDSVKTEINLPYITADATGPKHFDFKLSRAKLEGLTNNLIKRTVDLCKVALKDAGLSPGEINDVLLVGGQARMPKVKSAVAKSFGKQPRQDINSDEVVAVGAAIQGGMIAGKVDCPLFLLDVTPLSLGIETLGGVMTALIEKNTTIPTKAAQVFSTAEDNQTAVTVHVLQGQSEKAAENRSLGRFDLTDIPPAPRGIPQIEVTYDIDANGILKVSAMDKGTGKKQAVQVNTPSGITEAEIQRMIADASSQNTHKRVTRSDQQPGVNDSEVESETFQKRIGKIFISYRREDSQHFTGWLYEKLTDYFNKEDVFIDVDSIPLGMDFRKFLDKEVSKCQVMLVVIDKNWLTNADPSGNRRIDNPRDFVRIEIESALKRDIPIIPLLVGSTGMPSEDELPNSLKDMSYRNAINVRGVHDFTHDVGRLVKGIKKVLEVIHK